MTAPPTAAGGTCLMRCVPQLKAAASAYQPQHVCNRHIPCRCAHPTAVVFWVQGVVNWARGALCARPRSDAWGADGAVYRWGMAWWGLYVGVVPPLVCCWRCTERDAAGDCPATRSIDDGWSRSRRRRRAKPSLCPMCPSKDVCINEIPILCHYRALRQKMPLETTLRNPAQHPLLLLPAEVAATAHQAVCASRTSGGKRLHFVWTEFRFSRSGRALPRAFAFHQASSCSWHHDSCLQPWQHLLQLTMRRAHLQMSPRQAWLPHFGLGSVPCKMNEMLCW